MGTVREATDAKPLHRATVGTWRAPAFSFYRANELMFTRTDSLGKFALFGLPAGEHRIFAIPPEDRPLVPVQRCPRVVLEQAAVEVDFKMPRGVAITGTVTDRQTGLAVPGYVEAYVFNDNRFVQELRPTTLSTDHHAALVDEQGHFQIQSLPGTGVFAFRAKAQLGDQYRQGGGWKAIEHHRSRERLLARHYLFEELTLQPAKTVTWATSGLTL